MQYYSMAIDYPFNVGGRPENSWPVLSPSPSRSWCWWGLSAACPGMMFLNGLPHPHHPVFHVPQFVRSSQDRFFLCVEATDPRFHRVATAESLATLAPHGEVILVPRK